MFCWVLRPKVSWKKLCSGNICCYCWEARPQLKNTRYSAFSMGWQRNVLFHVKIMHFVAQRRMNTAHPHPQNHHQHYQVLWLHPFLETRAVLKKEIYYCSLHHTSPCLMTMKPERQTLFLRLNSSTFKVQVSRLLFSIFKKIVLCYKEPELYWYVFFALKYVICL